MAPSFSGVWKLQTKYQYNSAFPADPNLGAVGLYAGGIKTEGGTSYIAEVDKLLLAVNGNATDFGDLSTNRGTMGSASSDTRMLIGGGFYNDAGGGDVQVNTIEYFTYATAGNATDFGDLTATKYILNGLSNNVRGIFSGGSSGGSTINVIEFVTIATTGNATDFADLTSTYSNHGYGICASTTRGIIAGFNSNVIEYITIASAGNSTDFGDMTVTRKQGHAQMASATRGVFGGGRDNSNNASNIIDYITIASTGNATDFGDIATAKYATMGMSSLTKGFIAGGTTGSYENVIEQITIATTGNATDFGDLTRAKGLANGASNGQAAVQNEAFFAPAAIGVLGGGYANNEAESIIEYMNIASDGQVGVFGDLINPAYGIGNGAASTTRGISFGGEAEPQGGSSGKQDVIEFITFSTKGKATDFGNLAEGKSNSAGFSSSTRGITGGGRAASGGRLNVIEYVTIASVGNSTDFGDLSVGKERFGGASSTTRGLFLGGYDGSNRLNVIEYVTIASTGNVTDFGDLLAVKLFNNALSSNTRALSFGGATDGNVYINVIEYVTIASTGNATDFGDLSSTSDRASGVSDKTTGLIHAAQLNLSVLQLDKVTIASTGNASDYGDLTAGNYGPKFAASNSHGGIS